MTAYGTCLLTAEWYRLDYLTNVLGLQKQAALQLLR